MEDVALRLLRELPRTPMSAVGVNYQFIEEHCADALLRLFSVGDSPALVEGGFEVRETSIKRELFRDGTTLNLTLTLEPNNSVVFDFNFHYQVNSAEQGQECLHGHVQVLRHSAEEALRALYGVTPDDEHG